MEHASKMYLVPRHQLEQLGPSTDNAWDIRKNETLRLDAEIKDILKRTDLNPYDKAHLYSNTLKQFLNYYKQFDGEKNKLTLYTADSEQPSMPPTAPQPQQPPPVPVSTADIFVDDLLKNISQRHRGAAQMLMSKLAASNDLAAWNERGEFLYKGQPIAGSHMYDLVKGLTHNKTLTSQNAPRGWDQFLQAAAELNIPSALVGNSDHRRLLESLKVPFPPSPAASDAPRLSPSWTTPPVPRVQRKKTLSKPHNWITA